MEDYKNKDEGSPLSETCSISFSENVKGSHLFTIMNYSLTKGLGVRKYISSNEFHVGNSGWKIIFHPDGQNDDSVGYISLFVHLVSGELNTRATYSLCLLDQSGEKNHMVLNMEQVKKIEYTGGWPKFMKRDDFEASKFLKDDCLRVRCTIRVFMTEKTLSLSSVTLPPSDINLHVQNLLESGMGLDVHFHVNGESFSAHKIILGARSPVFKSQFFGNFKDEANPIIIQEMEVAVFKVMLHFIYYDDLPPDIDKIESQTPTSVYENLLIAVDRYDLARLKVLCATHLSKTISINNVTSTWALAEQHNCSSLKSYCIQFVASLNNLQDVVETSDFKEIKENDPSFACAFLQPAVSYKTDKSSDLVKTIRLFGIIKLMFL